MPLKPAQSSAYYLKSETKRDPLAYEHVHDRCVMGERSSDSLVTFAGHAQHVCSVAEGAAPLPGVEEISSSWQRSATKYGVDPVDNKAPRILTSGELTHSREPIDSLILSAQE